MTRRFRPGTRTFATGEEVKILRGRKGRGLEDLLVLLDTHGLQPIRMEVIAYAIAVILENEDHLYPPDQGFRGRKYFLNMLDEALTLGPDEAVRRYQLRKSEWAPERPNGEEPRPPGFWE